MLSVNSTSVICFTDESKRPRGSEVPLFEPTAHMCSANTVKPCDGKCPFPDKVDTHHTTAWGPQAADSMPPYTCTVSKRGSQPRLIHISQLP